jgi:YVTN family beta-propeller protein
MSGSPSLKSRLCGSPAFCATATLVITAGLCLAGAGFAQAAFNHPTYSSPIAISGDNKLVWSVNPAGNSVSVIRTDTNTKITDITVGKEPQNVALDPDNKFAYVVNTADNSVTVIKITVADPANFQASVLGSALTTGAEPWNLVTSPDGKRVFVANSGQDTITVIDPNAAGGPSIIGNVDLRNSLCNDPDRNRHFQPRGLAVTLDNSKLYFPRFLSFIKTDDVQGVDTGREGIVCRLDISTGANNISDYQPPAVISLGPQPVGYGAQNIGFVFPGLNEDTLCFPNQMQSIVLRGNQAYLPNICASPSDPLRFNIDTESFVSIIASFEI